MYVEKINIPSEYGFDHSAYSFLQDTDLEPDCQVECLIAKLSA